MNINQTFINTKKLELQKIIKMKIFKIILLSILFSGLNSSPVTRDTPMENHSRTGKQIRRRFTADDSCREMVFIICEEEKIDYPAKNRLQLNEQCKKDGFAYYCR